MLPPFSATLSPAFSLYLCSRSSTVSREFSTEYTASTVLWYWGRKSWVSEEERGKSLGYTANMFLPQRSWSFCKSSNQSPQSKVKNQWKQTWCDKRMECPKWIKGDGENGDITVKLSSVWLVSKEQTHLILLHCPLVQYLWKLYIITALHHAWTAARL